MIVKLTTAEEWWVQWLESIGKQDSDFMDYEKATFMDIYESGQFNGLEAAAELLDDKVKRQDKLGMKWLFQDTAVEIRALKKRE